MFFEITKVSVDEGDIFEEDFVEKFFWQYRQGTPEKPGDVVADAPDAYEDEQACRSNIAAARKAFGGSKFAKVVVA